MTDAITIALGRRALAAGFRSRVGGVLVRVTHDNGWEEHRFTGDADDAWIEEREGVPLFTDAATLGVLEAQVRERWDAWAVSVSRFGARLVEDWSHGYPDGEVWSIVDAANGQGEIARAADRASAWVAALEARRAPWRP